MDFVNSIDSGLQTWAWHPVVLAAAVTIVATYGRARARDATAGAVPHAGQNAALGTGIAVWVLACVSPIGVLANDGVLSAHVLEHFLVVMIAAPLLVAALPERSTRRALEGRSPAWIARLLSTPIVTWCIGTSAMLVWHMPAWHTFIMGHPAWRAVENLSWLAAAGTFWWPVFTPLDDRRLEPVQAIPYLATACIACTVCGIALAFSPAGRYGEVAQLGSGMQALTGVRDALGITPAVDRQIAGLIVWIPGCLVYIVAMLTTLGRSYATPRRARVTA
jgi:cytochrome c oxidase assembly factor CtaG